MDLPLHPPQAPVVPTKGAGAVLLPAAVSPPTRFGGSSTGASGADAATLDGIEQRQSALESGTMGLARLCGVACAIACPLMLEGRRRWRRRVLLRAAAGKTSDRAIQVAVNIGKEAERKRKMTKMSKDDKRKSREAEIKNKINILKGSRIARYKKDRDKKAEEAKNGPDDAEDEEEKEPSPSSSAEGKKDEDANGGEEALWSFKRDDPTKRYGMTKKPLPEVGEDARALAAVELEGRGGTASAVALIEAAQEFKRARDNSTAVQLLELARTRVDMDQIQRKIDLPTALALDEQCLWDLANTYSAMQRLTLAAQSFLELKERNLPDANQRLLADQQWAQHMFKIAEELYNLRRYLEALEVLETLRAETTPLVHGSAFQEEVELYVAMTLKETGKLEEAKEVLVGVQRGSRNKKRRMQAQFILDVMNVDSSGWRNQEFHEVFEESFNLPTGSYIERSQIRAPSARLLNMTPRERELRTWASKYWEERLKSPFYYGFLTLFVTWPFAIPVVAIWKRTGMAFPWM